MLSLVGGREVRKRLLTISRSLDRISVHRWKARRFRKKTVNGALNRGQKLEAPCTSRLVTVARGPPGTSSVDDGAWSRQFVDIHGEAQLPDEVAWHMIFWWMLHDLFCFSP